MSYDALKIMHVIIAGALSALYIAGVGFVFAAHVKSTNSPLFERYVGHAFKLNWWGVLPLMLIQGGLGFAIISVKHYALSSGWVVVVAGGFFVLMLLWLIQQFLLLEQRNNKHAPTLLLSHFYRWKKVTVCMVLIVLVMLYCMTNGPR